MARDFDGVDDQINFGTSTSYDLSTFTAMAWVKFAANFTAERMIVAKNTSGGTGRQYIATAVSAQNCVACFANRATLYAYSASAANVLTANAWNLVVATLDGGTTAPKLYVGAGGADLTEVATYTSSIIGSGAFTSPSAYSLRLGLRDGLDVVWLGHIAEAALWNRVLSAAELNALNRYASPLLIPSGLVFYSPTEGALSPEPDISVTAGSGTVTGAPQSTHQTIYRFQRSNINPMNGTQYALASGLGGALIE